MWLTETGGIVQFGAAFPNSRGSGLTRAAKVLKYMFAVAASQPQVKRLYIYDWTGGTAATRFDAGLMNAHDQPRAGYVVVCKQLHGAKCAASSWPRTDPVHRARYAAQIHPLSRIGVASAAFRTAFKKIGTSGCVPGHGAGSPRDGSHVQPACASPSRVAQLGP